MSSLLAGLSASAAYVWLVVAASYGAKKIKIVDLIGLKEREPNSKHKCLISLCVDTIAVGTLAVGVLVLDRSVSR
jgi:hypothetical protein